MIKDNNCVKNIQPQFKTVSTQYHTTTFFSLKQLIDFNIIVVDKQVRTYALLII